MKAKGSKGTSKPADKGKAKAEAHGKKVQEMLSGLNDNLQEMFDKHLEKLFDEWDAAYEKGNLTVERAVGIVRKIKANLQDSIEMLG